jgi:hypothetical protein
VRTKSASAYCLCLLLAALVGCRGVREDGGEIETIVARMKDPRFELQFSGALRGLANCKYVGHVLEAIGWPDGASWNQFDVKKAIARAGGVTSYRRRVGTLLEHKDCIVRFFGALWLGTIGGPENASELLTLLRSTNLPVEDADERGYDQAGGAIGLGILGAREHAEEIAGLLTHQIPTVRACAAQSLAYLKATEYADGVAALLSDEDKPTIASAMSCLRELGAPQYARAVAQAILAHPVGGSEVRESGLRALVAFDAREEVRAIAAFLYEHDPALAAAASALLGLKEQADKIAALLEDDWYVRSTACSALGLLGEDRYASRIAGCLWDDREYVRNAAAWALVLLESREHAKAAIAVIGADSGEKTPWFGSIGGIAGRERENELERRAQASLARLREQLSVAPKKN